MNAFLLLLGRKERRGGQLTDPWLCSITQGSGGSGEVGQVPYSWVRDGDGAVSDLNSQPESQNPRGFPQGWYGVCPISTWRCAARRCPVPVVPWAVPVPSLGTLSQVLIVVLLGQVGRQRTCPPGNTTAFRCCHAHPKTSLLGACWGLASTDMTGIRFNKFLCRWEMQI